MRQSRVAAQERRRDWAGSRPAALALLMFVAIFVLRLATNAPERVAIQTLYIAPILLISVVYGSRSGFVAATLAVVLIFLRADVQSAPPEALALVTRLFVFYGIPLTIWLTDQRARALQAQQSVRTGRAARDPQELTRREREVLGLLGAGHTN